MGRVRVAWFVVGVLVLHACGAPAALVVGPCGLEVNVYGQTGPTAERQRLDPPYVVTLPPTGHRRPHEPDISFTGTGWHRVQLTRTPPDADPNTSVVDGEMINDGSVGFPVDLPGEWRFRLYDANAGCERDFSVQVRE
jgi:hypothetical protein